MMNFLIKGWLIICLPLGLGAYMLEPCPEAQVRNPEAQARNVEEGQGYNTQGDNTQGENNQAENNQAEKSQAEEASTLSRIDRLDKEKRAIYNQLGPIYRKIFLLAFDNEERSRVVMYVHRGLSPYEAMNVILRAEQRKYRQSVKKESLTPAEKAMSPNKQTEVL